MYSGKQNQGVGAGAGGTANYPSNEKVSGQKVGYGYEAGKDVNTGSYPASQKSGYGVQDGNVYPQQSNGYVQQEPVNYGPDGMPVKKSRRMRNLIVGALAVACCCIVC